MARYQTARNGMPYGPPRRLRATFRHIRLVCKRDGKDFRWGWPNDTWTRPYHTRIRFYAAALAGLRRMKAGDLSKFQTRINSKRPPIRYHVRAVNAPKSTIGEQALERARTVLGTRYVFGSANGPEDAGPDSFDCSGLTQWAYEPFVFLPHAARYQQDSSRVTVFHHLGDAKPGDLVFMNFPNNRGIHPPTASHVGLFFAHASKRKPALMLDTRSPEAPVAIRPIELGNVVGYGRVDAN